MRTGILDSQPKALSSSARATQVFVGDMGLRSCRRPGHGDLLGPGPEGREDLGVNNGALFKLFSLFFITRKPPFLWVAGLPNLYPDPFDEQSVPYVSKPCAGRYEGLRTWCWREGCRLSERPRALHLPQSALPCSDSLGQQAFVPVEHGTAQLGGTQTWLPSRAHFSTCYGSHPIPKAPIPCLGASTGPLNPPTRSSLLQDPQQLGVLGKLRETT